MDFQQDSLRWREWATLTLGGTSEQVAAAGDAAAVTSALGSIDSAECVAAARAAFECVASAKANASKSEPYLSAVGSQVSPAGSFQALRRLGWSPVAIHQHHLRLDANEHLIATSRFSRSALRAVEATDAERAIEMIFDERSILETLVEDAGDALIAKAWRRLRGEKFGTAYLVGFQRPARRFGKFEWRSLGDGQYFLTNRRLLLLTKDKWAPIPFDSIVEMKAIVNSAQSAIQILSSDNSLGLLGLMNPQLHAGVLDQAVTRFCAQSLPPEVMKLASVAINSPDGSAAVRAAVQFAATAKESIFLAKLYLRLAANRGPSETSARAWFELGRLWLKQSAKRQAADAFPKLALDRAREALESAIRANDVAVLPWARCLLGLVFWNLGNSAEGIRAFSSVVAMPDCAASVRAQAQFFLALTSEFDLHDGPQARRYYEQAISSGDVEWASQAALVFGIMLARAGQTAGAMDMLEQTISLANPKWTPRAELALGELRARAGDQDGGRVLVEQAIASQHPMWMPMGQKLLAESELFKEAGHPAS
jgi:tetratricopeptide (TPR) repeat protein